MYIKFLANGQLNRSWYDGVLHFVEYAFSNKSIVSIRDGKECVSCPCKNCDNMYFLDRNTIVRHLLNGEFCSNYTCWSEHGEGTEAAPPSSSTFNENQRGMDEMLHDAAGPSFNWEDPNIEQQPNSKAKKFFDMLLANEEPLWEIDSTGEQKIKCDDHSVLSAVIKCLSLKAEHQLSQKCFNGMLKIMKEMLPEGDKLPENFYQCKRLVSGLLMDYKRYDICPKFCMLYYGDRLHKEKCDECGEDRYEPQTNPKKKRVAKKTLRYLPITERLQRLYMTRANAEHMRYHKEGVRENEEMMVHPTDGEDWKQFDLKYPEFAAEVRNVRLGLSTDGFMPFNSTAAPYSCWPVFVFPYNLLPGLLMKEETMFLTLILPGPVHPGRDLDICLEPLIDELKSLWFTGVETYDVSRKQNFLMKAVLMWTVSDFPALAMLSGWGTHGKMACPRCGANSKAFTLLHGGKPSWFDCHRCFLPQDHEFRRDKKIFKKNKVETDGPPPMLTGEQELAWIESLDGIDEMRWGKNNPINQIPGYGTTHHWQKKSIFWSLTYWSSLKIRHNIDMMHLEKNFMENLFFIILNIKKRTKDNPKARQDLEVYCNRPQLHLSTDLKKKPDAPYALSSKKRRQVLKWLKENVKFPDGYASNWSRCVNLAAGTVSGVKSHDYHVFMERLMPAAFRDFVPDEVWTVLCEVSSFFREICAKEIDPKRILKLENDIPITLCKLEKLFPPGFFDSMEHLVVHVAYEARMGGPIGPRWMYSSERRMKDTRMMVTNKARVEASICEARRIKEVADFCSIYFSKRAKRSHLSSEDSMVIERPVVFDKVAYPLGRGRARLLDETEYKAAHNYVLFNSPEIKSLLLEFDAQKTAEGFARRMGGLEKARQDQFADWVQMRVLNGYEGENNIYQLGLKPEKRVMSYEGCEVNGFQFYTQAHEEHRSRDNSGVCVRGETNHRTEHDYYGILKEVIELEYDGVDNKVLLFKCHWFDIRTGVKIDDEHGIVEIKPTSTLCTNEPFVLACQATQVYYLPYASKQRHQWCIAMKTKKKGKLGVEDINENQDFFQEEQPNCPISISTGHEFVWDDVIIEPHQFEPVNPDDLSYRTIEDLAQVEQDEEIEEQAMEEEFEEPEEDSSDGEDL